MANICWKKANIDNRARALESTNGLLHFSKISWTVVYKRLKTGPEVLSTLIILFRRSLSYIFYAPLNSQRNGIVFACSSDLKPQKMSTWKCYRVGRP